MALTITNYQICSTDFPQPAGLGGGWSVTWMSGRVLPEGQAAAMQTAEAGPSDGLARGWLWRCRGRWSRRRQG
jgi:hypothetical protein